MYGVHIDMKTYALTYLHTQARTITYLHACNTGFNSLPLQCSVARFRLILGWQPLASRVVAGLSLGRSEGRTARQRARRGGARQANRQPRREQKWERNLFRFTVWVPW